MPEIRGERCSADGCCPPLRRFSSSSMSIYLARARKPRGAPLCERMLPAPEAALPLLHRRRSRRLTSTTPGLIIQRRRFGTPGALATFWPTMTTDRSDGAGRDGAAGVSPRCVCCKRSELPPPLTDSLGCLSRLASKARLGWAGALQSCVVRPSPFAPRGGSRPGRAGWRGDGHVS